MTVDRLGKVDPITLEVISSDLSYGVREMRSRLIRMSYSPILYETHDFSCAIASPGGEIVAMSVDLPVHTFPMVFAIEALTEKYGLRPDQGDVYLVNDPYSTGTHLNDLLTVTPFYYDDELRFYICVRAHYGDVGGSTPGSMSGEATEIFHEGIRIPPVKARDAGQLNRDVLDLFLANVRQPYEAEGVFTAQVAVADLAKERLTELFELYGTETVGTCVEATMDRAEEQIRSRLRGLPDGTYYSEDYLQDSGGSPDPLVVRCKLTIDDDRALIDFSGSSDAVAGVGNSTYPITRTAVYNVVQTVLGSGEYSNTGGARPIEVIAPKGTIMNPEFPLPAGGWPNVAFGPTHGAVLQAFSQVLPEEVSAPGHASANQTVVAGTVGRFREDKYWLLFEFASGSWPATAQTDGPQNCYQWWMGDVPTIWPVERLELLNPGQVDFNQMLVDSGGPGHRRGGVGLRRGWRVLSPAQISVLGTDSHLPRVGMAMGYGGAMNWVTVLRGGVEQKMSELPMRVGSFALEPDDLILTLAAGGGGYGDPLTRPPEWVLDDVRAGYVSREGALADYGVVLGDDGSVDAEATADRRQALVGERVFLDVSAAAEDDYDDLGRRILRVSPEAARRLQVEDADLAELVPEVGACLRTWIRVDDSLAGTEVPLGPRGRQMARVGESGGRIWVRTPWTHGMRVSSRRAISAALDVSA